VVRKHWAERDQAFAALGDRARKGTIRRAVRKLEATGEIVKDGHLFSLPKRNGNGSRK
jgi:hypothetical protein